MREIKFRGYAMEEMVYSQWIHGFGISELKFAEHYAKEVGRSSDWWIYTEGGDYRIDPKSIGQYTNLKDKNDREIYEGDIICYNGGKTESRAKMTVKWVDAGFVLSAYKEEWSYNLGECISSTLEIIGNLYENPELAELS